MSKIALYGAGKQGRTAAALLLLKGSKISCFIDSDEAKHGTTVLGIPVIGIKEYVQNYSGDSIDVIVAVSTQYQSEAVCTLRDNDVENILIFDKTILLEKERIVSWSYPTENEDIILYHILKDEDMNRVFWIDVGSNDPSIGSVTKLFYDRGGQGINIDMEPALMEITRKERPRDINICCGIGGDDGDGVYYSQGDWGGLSTMIKDNTDENAIEFNTKIRTLRSICDEYIKKMPISFLKIDVEGKEKDVLLGMDFQEYRPKILVIESTLPRTNIPNYNEWENIVTSNEYIFAYAHGVNRYYVAKEKKELLKKFEPWEKLAAHYCIMHADLLFAI